MRKIYLIIILICLLIGTHKPAQAQAGSAYDLIAEVNAYRAANGLEQYTVDSFLMEYAQSHAEYCASLGYGTHTHQDGTVPFDSGIQENVASGTNMSVSFTIYTIWSDPVHWKLIAGNSGGRIGAGAATSGDLVYYTLNVIPSSTSVSVLPQNTTVALAAIQPQATQDYISEVITNTPNADGIIVHFVKYGESLWSIAIAYGTTGAEIMGNSGFDPSTTNVFEGQKLIIKTASPPTATIQPSKTPIPPTPTITPPRPTRTPMPTRTPQPTPTPTQAPPVLYRAFGNSLYLGIGLTGLSLVGLIIVLFFGFLRKPKP